MISVLLTDSPLLEAAAVPGSLSELHREFARCHRCSLADTRRRVLCASRFKRGGLMLIADRVTGYEEWEERVLAGETGALLDRILSAPGVNLAAEPVCVTALVACRSRRGKLPGAAEIRACGARLQALVTVIQPVIIVALGLCTGKALVRSGITQPAIDGRDYDVFRGIPVRTTCHPAEALWGVPKEVTRIKRILYQDWKAISAHYFALKTTR